jgi:hypothetical protein
MKLVQRKGMGHTGSRRRGAGDAPANRTAVVLNSPSPYVGRGYLSGAR